MDDEVSRRGFWEACEAPHAKKHPQAGIKTKK